MQDVPSLPATLFVLQTRIDMCKLIARYAPCVDRIAEVMQVDREEVWKKLDGRSALSLMDVSDIAYALGLRVGFSLERRAT